MKPQRDMVQLGRLIQLARESKGLSARKLEDLSGLDHSFISKLEKGVYGKVAPDSLIALARALDLPTEDLFALGGYRVPEGLPSFGPYLRARYGETLPDGARAALTELFDTLRRQYGGSDEVDDEDEDLSVSGRAG